MTRPVRTAEVKEADAVDALLRNVTPEVVDRYASVVKDRYASVAVDRYASGKPDRYAGIDRYASVGADPSQHAAGKGGSRKRILKTTIVLVQPPSGFKGDMLYLPAAEFERAYDYEYSSWMDQWQAGHVLNFSEAAECAWETQCAYGDYNDGAPCLLQAVAVSSVSDTFCSDTEIWGEHESAHWPEALALARKIRAKLVADPQLVLACLEDYRWAAIIAGGYKKNQRPEETDVLAALARSTSTGLGAAAIDLIVWNGSDLIDECHELDRLVEMIREVDCVPEVPAENFILDSGDLHPGTHRVESAYGTWYDLFGEYVIVDAEYHSDLCRTRPYGWRNCRLVPHGDPILPKFGGSETPSYPQAFADKAQTALFD